MELYKCGLSIVPCKAEGREQSEIVTQLLYGEMVRLKKTEGTWANVISEIDDYDCWIDKKIFDSFKKVEKPVAYKFSNEPLTTIDFEGKSHHILMGSEVSSIAGKMKPISYETKTLEDLDDLVEKFLGAPYLWGGKSIFGVDCSGFTQIILRVMGKQISRDASQQVKEGVEVTNITEAAHGDLAFFNNNKGKITHVGIVFKNKGADSTIVHSSGWVREDLLDAKGIFDREKKEYTHELHSIRRFFLI